jgi:hypothetical protein
VLKRNASNHFKGFKNNENYFFFFFQKSAKWHTLRGFTGSNFMSENKTIIVTFTA